MKTPNLILQSKDVIVEVFGEGFDHFVQGPLLLQDGEPLLVQDVLPKLANRPLDRILEVRIMTE